MRSRERLTDVMMTINPDVAGVWAAGQLRQAAGVISTGVCTPAMHQQLMSRLDTLCLETRSEHIRETARQAQICLGDLNHG